MIVYVYKYSEAYEATKELGGLNTLSELRKIHSYGATVKVVGGGLALS